MDLIVKAKNAQAEEANRAAESLLALLAEEEEAARSKKQAKLRKKEKKKEKKAKKHDCNDKERSTSSCHASAPASTTEESPNVSRVKEESEDYSDDGSDSVAVKKEQSFTKAAPMANDRVPEMRTVEEPLVICVTPERPNPAMSRQQKRSANRRNRNESGKSSNGQLSAAAQAANNAAQSKVAPSPVLAAKTLVTTEEWVKASKKTKAPSKPKMSAGVITAVGKDFYLDDNYSGWKDVELSRRRSTTLSVCSSVIARVIGRGGANINAIREATGASIEVEKQSAVRRDQHDRQICIRGTQDTVRNATLMINGLITDHEISVTDVIRQVLRGNASSTTPSDGSRIGVLHDSRMTATVSSASATSTKPISVPPVTTNVWQQRMAARQREQQQQQQLAMSSCNSTKESCPAPPSSTDTFSSSVASTSANSLLRNVALYCSDSSTSMKTNQAATASLSSSFATKTPSAGAAAALSVPTGSSNSSLSMDKELPRKAPGYRSPSVQTSSSSSIPTEQAILSSVPSSVSSTPPPSHIVTDPLGHSMMGSSPAPILPPPAAASVKAAVSPLKSSLAAESSAVDAAMLPLNDTNGANAHAAKRSNADVLNIPTGAENDLTSMHFLDETTRAKLAEIWGTGKQDQSSQEQAWGNQVLLNNFANLNIRSSSTDWAGVPHDNLFMSSPPAKTTANVSSNQQITGTHQSGTTFVTSPSCNEWPVSSAKSVPLYARPQARIPSVPSQSVGVSSSASSAMPRPYSSSSNQPENNMLFNQLAAQLLIQQQGVASTPVPPAQSYYPSPSYTDPAIIGMGHLSTTSAGAASSSSAPSMKSAYSNPYQAASNEYESLNSLLNSSFGHHQNGDFNIAHASSAYPSSPSAARSLNASRIQPGGGGFAPPPGFGSAVSSQSAPGIGGANPAVPPPSLRPYYNTQMPPPAGLPIQPSQHASFAAFNSQHNNWMSSNHGKQAGGLQQQQQQQQMPWWN